MGGEGGEDDNPPNAVLPEAAAAATVPPLPRPPALPSPARKYYVYATPTHVLVAGRTKDRGSWRVVKLGRGGRGGDGDGDGDSDRDRDTASPAPRPLPDVSVDPCVYTEAEVADMLARLHAAHAGRGGVRLVAKARKGGAAG